MRAALALLALAAVQTATPCLAQAQDPGAEDPAAKDSAARPSVIAPLAVKSLMLDLARAGPRVFAVGERGHVLYSTDEGRSWTQVQVPGSANLNAVYFSDATHGWAVGHAEMILRTTDGGNSWERVHFAPENLQPLLDVWFSGADHGLAVGAYGVIYASTDGGAVWGQVPFEPVPLADAAATPTDPEDMEAEVDLGFEFHLNAIAHGPDKRLYLGAEAGRLFRSDDDGATWRELPSPYDGSFYGILPLDGDALLAFGLRGNLFRSDDGGMTWTAIPTDTLAMLTSGARVDASTIVISGMAGVLLVSRDGGHGFTLSQQDDRKAISAVLPSGDGELIVAGEGGVRRLPIPAAGAAP